MLRSLLLFALVLLTGCATLVNGERQQVMFKGGPEGRTRVQTPDGPFDVDGGTGSYMMTRSKSDLPIKVTCPDGTTKSGIAPTSWSWGWGVFGNLLNNGIGWFIDPFTDRAYTIDDVSLATYCPTNATADAQP